MWKLVWMLVVVHSCMAFVLDMVECRCLPPCWLAPVELFALVVAADMVRFGWFYSGIFRNSLWLIEIVFVDLLLFSYKYYLVLGKHFLRLDFVLSATIDWKIDFAYSAPANKKLFHCRHCRWRRCCCHRRYYCLGVRLIAGNRR